MASSTIQILDTEDIDLILKRMAYQVLEFFYGQDHIYILGIQPGGMSVARQIQHYIQESSKTPTTIYSVDIEKDKPESQVHIGGEIPENAGVLLVDDVANSGRTLAYSLPSILQTSPRAIKIAVLVDRKHKRFPITADIVGKKLSTNLNEKVIVEFDKEKRPKSALLTDQ